MKPSPKFAFALFCAAFLLAAWGQEAPPSRAFTVNGVVKELPPGGKSVVIQHEAITNYMPAMTMPFDIHDTNLLHGLTLGDDITFHLTVTEKDGWIDAITVRKKAAAPAPAPAPAPISFSHAVNELDSGDLVPDYHFTNELGKEVHLSQYRGRVVALTFFFTSCIYPTFCPRMTGNFAETATTLSRVTGPDGRWQLLSISFDPKTDTPGHLKDYAEGAHYDPAHWSFLTGDSAQINELADQFGESFARVSGTISHNLRTVVIGPQGRVSKILPGNTWTSDDLVSAMLSANPAAAQPKAR